MIKIDDRIIGIIGFIGSAFFMTTIYHTAFETKAFPMLCLGIMMVLSAILVLRKSHQKYELKNVHSVLLTLILMLLYVLGLSTLGFLPSSILFLLAYVLVNKYEGKRIVAIAYSMLLPLLLFGLFQTLFSVRLPQGIF